MISVGTNYFQRKKQSMEPFGHAMDSGKDRELIGAKTDTLKLTCASVSFASTCHTYLLVIGIPKETQWHKKSNALNCPF